jgi:hypothetical protein
MKRPLVAALALLALVNLTGLDGCRAYEFEVVQPPGSTSLDEALVVIMDTHTGRKVVVPYPQFVALSLDRYDSIEALEEALGPTHQAP